MFRVTLVNLTEHRKDSWEYEDLLSALTVAKNVDTSTPDDLVVRPAMSNEFFNTHLWELLTMGFVYVREDVMVFLWKLDGNEERPVVSAITLMDSLTTPVDKPFIPKQFPVEPFIKPSVAESNIVLGED